MKFYRSLDELTLPGSIFDRLGRHFLSTVLGKQVLLFFQAVVSLFSENRDFKTDFRNILRQVFFTGVEVFPVLFIVATLIGTVTIVEALTVMPKVGFSDSFGSLMVIVFVRELGPILTAFLVAGRSGSALTTMLGTMSINSEVDALSTMGVNPIRYLVMPALFGGILAMWIMNIMFSVSGIGAGFLATKALIAVAGSSINVHISWHYLSTAILHALTFTDFVMTMLKPFVFAIIIFVNACYQGLNIRRDIRQVPKATSRSVIYSFLFVIVSDVILSSFYIFDYLNQVAKFI